MREIECSERGFTVIEGLIATAILLVVAIGVIPLFASSILNNTRGSDSMLATNFSKTATENLIQIPFNSGAVTVPAGQAQLTVDDWWSPGRTGRLNDPTQGWQAGSPSAGTTNIWTRSTTVQDYSLNDILTSGRLTTPLPGGTQPTFVQLKLITVNVRSSKPGGILGAGERIALQSIKAF
jgi:type II secretory pathway pseudopilin PulG